MQEIMRNGRQDTPILFPCEPDLFWRTVRQIIREELETVTQKAASTSNLYQTPGLTSKPLYKINELCSLFQVSKPTIYDWIKHGKLKPFKIRSRVFFLWQDVQQLLHH